MLRERFAAAFFILFVPAAFACDGQAGNVIFEDKFTDDSGGWNFGENYGLILKAPGATLSAKPSNDSGGTFALNQTFNVTQGDFCTEMSLPGDAAQLGAAIGVAFLATDYSNYYVANADADGKVSLYKKANGQWSKVWDAVTNNLVKTGPTDVNSVRAVVKNGTITVIVNGQTVKSVRALIPKGDFLFGFHGEYSKPSTTPVSFTVRSYKVTTTE